VVARWAQLAVLLLAALSATKSANKSRVGRVKYSPFVI
jgi:hypothetical protein